ncbi:glycosyltransferase family 2 protein [Rufibacter latericius]|uniref:Glycosyltransferase n=1 Tax=Rufibacter latericius TaxID=2487040 RepID=A0A3M9MI84_9BACT|nr:glycosyltransferase family A protein [Rufibacter latericius]RNI24543.1 glycosyltransferase [Rufibacter latericius]
MKSHPAYHIAHIPLDRQLLALPQLTDGDHGHYLVFWWDQMALGDLYLAPKEELTSSTYKLKVIEAIRPAVNQYASALGLQDNWVQWLENGNSADWAAWMEGVFAKTLPKPLPSKVDVSVVICTRNRSVQLEQCLIRLRELQCLPVEVIVVDNAPSDNSSQQVVRRFEEVLYVKEPRAGLDIARNTGVKKASAPIVAYVDDDVTVHPLWVYRVWETFQNPETAAMTGLVIAAELQTEAQFIFEKHWSFNRGYQGKWYDANFFQKNLALGPPVWEIGAGANMAFRKSVFEEVGYFDELLDVGAAGCNGDSEMWFRILAQGHTIHYNPKAIVYHEHRKELSGLQKQIFFYMRGFTTAALLQQEQQQQANYKRRLWRVFPKYYVFLALRGFPRYRYRTSTLWSEVKGIVSGYRFYLRNREASTSPKQHTAPSKSLKAAIEVTP